MPINGLDSYVIRWLVWDILRNFATAYANMLTSLSIRIQAVKHFTEILFQKDMFECQ